MEKLQKNKKKAKLILIFQKAKEISKKE